MVAAAGRAAADVVTYNFTGSVTSVTDGAHFALNETIPVGTAVTGSFSYDTAVVGVPFDFNHQATYAGAPVAFSVNVGGGLLTYNPATFNFSDDVHVFNDLLNAGDGFTFEVGSSPATGLTLPAAATTSANFALISGLILADTTEALFSSTALPTTLNLGDFNSKLLHLQGGDPHFDFGSASGIDITLNSPTLQPEAAPLPSVACGGLALCAVFVLANKLRKYPTTQF
jgi:hypothetical protein